MKSSRDHMPECRYCKSKIHTVEEWDKCVLSHSDSMKTNVPLQFKGVGDKLVKDCDAHEIMMTLQALCPHGLIIARPLKPDVETGGDVEILFSGRHLVLLKLSQLISYVAISGFSHKDNPE